MVFFFQAEDGIRDYKVTGVQTCALPISAYVLVDAFDVPAATISRLQQTDTAVSFTGGGWMQGITTDRWSGGSAAASITAGDQATFTFAGTGVRWLGAVGPENGIARVSLDGVFVTEVNAFAPPGVHPIQVQAQLFKANGLADTSHTLTIEVTGRKDPASTDAIIVVDAFDVMKSGTRREETDPSIAYTAGWSQGNRNHPYSVGTAALSA